MKVLNAEFIKSCYQVEEFPRDRLPEIAFVGRSNVGKSSLINSVLHRRKLAQVSRTPGRTRAINFFRVAISDRAGKSLYVVDLPGYGYARVAKSVRDQWGPMIEGYLTQREALRGVVFLVDARGLEHHDRVTMEWLRALRCPVLLVMTKVDKLSRGERSASEEAVREGLGLLENEGVILYSSATHEGRDALWRGVLQLLR